MIFVSNVHEHKAGGPTAQKRVDDLRMTRCSQFNYEPFNSNSVNIRFWSWNYRGCWHQTCPPIDTHQCVWIQSIANLAGVNPTRMLFFVAASPCWHWAICAPAARHSDGCRLSGTLSGIEPQSSVTRKRHGSPLHYHLPDRW